MAYPIRLTNFCYTHYFVGTPQGHIQVPTNLAKYMCAYACSVYIKGMSCCWLSDSNVLCCAPNARLTLNSPPFCTCFNSGPTSVQAVTTTRTAVLCFGTVHQFSESYLSSHCVVPACVTRRCPRADPATKQTKAPEAGGSSSGRAISREGRDPCRACMSSFACCCLVQPPMQFS